MQGFCYDQPDILRRRHGHRGFHGISAALFASAMGPGVAFSALPVFVYQGAITLPSSLAKGFLGPAAAMEMSAAGGLLIIGIGINILNIREIRVGSFCWAVFYAIPMAHWLPRIIPGWLPG